jgi:hypothetical protein
MIKKFHPCPLCHAAFDEWKEEKKQERKVEKEKKKARSGGDLTPEQLLALQQELFQQSRQRTLAMLPPVQDDTSKAADQHAGAES